jgi:HK97 family phage prohead protease
MKNPEFEIRSENDELVFEGWASVFDTPYAFSYYTEEIRRGAFKRSLNTNPDVPLLVNHEGLPIARTRSGTMMLSEDRIGLHVEAKLDKDDPVVQDIARKMKRGDVSEMSFGFQAVDQEWSADFDKRVILAAEINRGDVSICTHGANPATSSSIRSGLTLEQRKAKAEELGREFRGGVVYTGKPSSEPGELRRRVLSEPSPLDSVIPITTYWERLRDLRSGTASTGDAVADARALLDRNRHKAIQKELAEHRERVAKEDRGRDYDRRERERRWRRYGGC